MIHYPKLILALIFHVSDIARLRTERTMAYMARTQALKHMILFNICKIHFIVVVPIKNAFIVAMLSTQEENHFHARSSYIKSSENVDILIVSLPLMLSELYGHPTLTRSVLTLSSLPRTGTVDATVASYHCFDMR